MTDPQSSSQTLDDQLERGLRDALALPARPQARPPASSAGPAPVAKWGPTTTRTTSPLQLLSDVTDNAYRLHEQLQHLVTSVTGENAPAGRIRNSPMKASGLLPAISVLAQEIDAAHGEIARLVQHLQSRIS